MFINEQDDFAHAVMALGASLKRGREDCWVLSGAERSPWESPITWVPDLGELIWKDDSGYRARIYKTHYGTSVGYVRVPDYNYDPGLVAIFADTIARFERETQALVFDQVDNRGGSMFQMYALLSLLTDRALPTPTHQITIDDDYAAIAADTLEIAAMGDAVPVEERPSPQRIEYCRLILAEHAAGRGTASALSQPLHLEGIAEVLPAAHHYTKKLIVVNDALTMSAGEFLAAMLQDGNRATMFGRTTAGAGGCAKYIPMPTGRNLGIEGITLTWTIATRSNGRYIENIGIEPDIDYSLTVEDYRSNFSDALNALLKTIESKPSWRELA